MALRIYNASADPADVIEIACIDHRSYSGSRQTKAYLEGCLGCRAVYAVRKARDKDAPGRMVPVLRIEIDEKPFRRFA